MSAAAPAPTDQPSRSGFLLGVVRRLIDYGKQLADRLRGNGAEGIGSAVRGFGTRDVALIFARITRGLLLANALEARLVHAAARLDAGPRRPSASPALAPRPPRPAAPIVGPATDPLAAMPTEAEIAEAIRRRPIGAVVADICRDLGILPCHPLWHDLRQAIFRHGGNYARLVIDILDRSLFFLEPDPPPPAVPAVSGGTGPP